LVSGCISVFVFFPLEQTQDKDDDELQGEKDDERQHKLYGPQRDNGTRLVYHGELGRIEAQDIIDVYLVHDQGGDKVSNSDDDDKVDKVDELGASFEFFFLLPSFTVT
jgi:hypothetical protein